MATRWGIISAGKISMDFVNAMRMLPESEHQPVAVAARSLERAQEFAAKYNIPRAYGDYKEIAKATDIDCVYIGSIHPEHHTLCEMFLNAGMNVLCEKPMSMNAKQCTQILALAQSQNVFFMEGIWSRFFPVYADLRRELDSGCIGEVRSVHANFGVNVFGVERLHQKALGGGAQLDLGVYPLQFAQFVYNGEQPVKITSSACLNSEGVDMCTVTTLMYSGNRIAVLTCSAICQLENTATICGTKGSIKIPELWVPVRMETPNKTYEHPIAAASKPMNYLRSEGFMYEIQAVRECLLKGLKEHPKVTHAQSLRICQISDEIRKQCGIVYEQDLL